MRKEISLIFLLLVGIGFASASNLVSFSYNLAGTPQQSGELKFSDVLLRIDDAEGLNCKYSENQGIPYEDMQGSFDYLIGSSYYKNFIDLFDGNYRVYVKCQNLSNPVEPEELQILLRINALVKGQIILSEDAPLNDGQIEVNLITSKVVSQAPILTYSFDGVKYNPIALTGSEKNWEGHLVLDRTLGEGVLFFKMKAVDLEGRLGEEITLGNSFPYDTIIPGLIADIKAISDVDEIKLEWHAPDDAAYFKIYRSTSPNVGYTDFYDESDEEEFIDNSIEDGKTYYYRVTSVDASGNEADLSKEVSGVSLKAGEDTDTGLSPVLRGRVESYILEIESLEERISEVSLELSNLNEKEKDFFTRLKMFDKISQISKSVSSLKSSVEKYKDLDLTSEELDKRISSSRVQLEVYQRDLPSSIEIIEEKERVEEIDEEFMMNALYELDNFLSEKERDKSIKETFDLIKEHKIKIESSFSSIEIQNLDGSTHKYYLVKRNLVSNLEKMENAYFLEILPEKIVENGKVEVKTIDHEFLSDNVIAFGADNKEIFYYIQGISEFSQLEDIQSGFVSVFEEENPTKGLTGLAIFGSGEKNYSWILGVVFLALIGAYFLYAKMNNYSDDYFRVLNKISEISRFLKDKKIGDSKKVYFGVKNLYGSLERKEKEKIYGKIQMLYNDILISEVEEGLEKLKESKDKALFEKIQKIYDGLPSIHKEKVSTLFNKLKDEIENEK